MVEETPARLRSTPKLEPKINHKHTPKNPYRIRGNDRSCHHEFRKTEDNLRNLGKFRTCHVIEHLLELRHNEQHQEGHDRHGDKHDDHRIDHRGHNLVLQLMGFLLVFSQTSQDHFENTSKFSSLHHVDIEFIKNFGMLRQTL